MRNKKRGCCYDYVTSYSGDNLQYICFKPTWSNCKFDLFDIECEEILKQTDEVGSKMFLYLENVQDKVKEIKSKMKAEQIICLPIWNSMPFPLKQIVKQKSCRDNSLDEFLKKGSKEIVLKKERYQPNMPAVIVYTSGTTGEPKGVLHTNDSLNAVAFQYKLADMGLTTNSRVLNAIPPFLGFGITVGIHTQLVLGLEGILQIDRMQMLLLKL